MTRRPTTLATAALGAAIALGLASCGYDQGPAGKVVGRDSDHDCHTTGTGKHSHRSCHTEYKLSTRAKDGTVTEFDAPYSAYDHCFRGSTYPACVKR